MRLLLDSHVILWWDSALDKLSLVQRDAIGDPQNEIFVSVASDWELAIKRASGTLAFADSLHPLCQRYGFVELPITMGHGGRAASLPMIHKDPFAGCW